MEQAVDLVGVVHRFLVRHPTTVAAAEPTLVETAHVVAHDQDVDALDALGANDRRVGEDRKWPHRDELAVQRIVGSELVDEPTAHGAAERRRARTEDVVEEPLGPLVEPLPVGTRWAELIGHPEVELQPEGVSHRVEHRERGRDDFGADPFSGEHTDRERGAGVRTRSPSRDAGRCDALVRRLCRRAHRDGHGDRTGSADTNAAPVSCASSHVRARAG